MFVGPCALHYFLAEANSLFEKARGRNKSIQNILSKTIATLASMHVNLKSACVINLFLTTSAPEAALYYLPTIIDAPWRLTVGALIAFGPALLMNFLNNTRQSNNMAIITAKPTEIRIHNGVGP